MGTKMFLNLAVKDLNKSVEFFTKLGFTFNPHFTNENATCMLVGEDSFVMLLVEDFFKTFTSKNLCDTQKDIEALIAISTESKARVDEMLSIALAAGAKEPKPASDQGFMYTRDIEDLDGHIWEIFWMDPSAVPNS